MPESEIQCRELFDSFPYDYLYGQTNVRSMAKCSSARKGSNGHTIPEWSIYSIRAYYCTFLLSAMRHSCLQKGIVMISNSKPCRVNAFGNIRRKPVLTDSTSPSLLYQSTSTTYPAARNGWIGLGFEDNCHQTKLRSCRKTNGRCLLGLHVRNRGHL